MSGRFSRGIVLEQHKEPALSREIVEFLNESAPKSYFEADIGYDRESLSADDIIELSELAEIIDESDGKKLCDKLRRAIQKGNRTIVVADAVDDEPYISSQMAMLFKKADEMCEGLLLCQKAMNLQKGAVAVYKNLTDLSEKIPHSVWDMPVVRVFGKYPVQERIQDFFENEKVFLIGSNALVHLSRAFREHRKQTTTFVTVGGDCIETQQNVEVEIGAEISSLLKLCGLSEKPESVVIGGSLTGTSVIDPDQMAVTPMTNAVLAFRENKKEKQYVCIGCARCVDVCPQSLTPFYLYKNIERGYTENLEFYDIDRCIECGSCSYICPSKLDVAAKIIKTKHEIQSKRAAKRREKKIAEPAVKEAVADEAQ